MNRSSIQRIKGAGVILPRRCIHSQRGKPDKSVFSPPPAQLALLLSLLFLILTPPLYAQSYFTVHYTEDNGPPSSEFYSIAQDSKGVMWFAMRTGICSYDGEVWTSYGPKDGLDDVGYRKVFVDRSDRVWALSQDDQLFDLHEGRWIFQGMIPTGNHHQPDRKNGALLQRGGDVLFAVCLLDSLGVFRDGMWTLCGLADHGHPVHPLSVIAHDSVFVVGTNHGLRVFDGNRFIDHPLVHLPFPDKVIRGLAQGLPDSSGESRLWYVGDKTIGVIEGGRLRVLGELKNGNLGNEKYPLVIAPDGTGRGAVYGFPPTLFWFRENRAIRPFRRKNGLVSDGATDVFLDREHILWVASTRGLTKIPSFRFQNFNRDDGLLHSEVSAILEPTPGHYIFGHFQGLTLYDGEKFTRIPLYEGKTTYSSSRYRVMDLVKGKDGRIWIAGGYQGLLCLTPDRRIHQYGLPFRREMGIDALAMGNDGKVLVGSSVGLFTFDPKREEFHLASPPANYLIRRIYQDSQDSSGVYMATFFHGIVRWSPRGVTEFFNPDNPQTQSVFNVTRTSDGTLLAGTAAGLFRVDGPVLRPMNLGGTVISKPVYLFINDGDSLWVGTDNGVYLWDGKAVRHFNTHDGLSGLETNRNAGLVDHEGHVWIGTSSGASCYYPEYDYNRNLHEVPEIVSIQVDSLYQHPTKPIWLDASHNDFIVNYRLVSFLDENRIEYEYSLRQNGHPDFHTAVTNARAADFLHLQPGVYRFTLRARIGNGPWSEEVQSVPIHIAKPFFERAWVRILGLVLIVGFIVFVDRFLVNLRARRRLAGEVEDERTRMRAIIGHTKILLMHTDSQGGITYINPIVKEVLGYDAQEIVGHPYTDFVHPDDIPGVRRNIRSQITERRSIGHFQCRFATHDKRWIWHDVSSHPLFENGALVGMSGVALDISERKHLEEQLHQSQKMEAVGLLAGGIAHDFNNLLTAINGHVDLARGETLPDGLTQHLNEIQKAADRAARLTHQLLAFSRKQTLQPRIVDLNEIVRGMGEMLHRILGEDIHLYMELPDGLWTVKADASQIEQVVVNLAVNARDAMPMGGQLEITTSNVHREGNENEPESPSEGDYVQLTIRDTGSGMSPEVKERVFEPFFTTKATGRGTGLGLSTVYGIVKQSNGYIALDSRPGFGTTFQILFPRAASPQVVTNGRETVETLQPGTESILVVEDDDAVRNLASHILGKLGYQVIEAATGFEALTLMTALPHPVDLLLTDVIMPQMNGPELADNVHDRWPGVKILFMSGYTASIVENRGMLDSETDLLQKPFTPRLLASRVREVLDKK